MDYPQTESSKNYNLLLFDRIYRINGICFL
jgi:hypothetical protein